MKNANVVESRLQTICFHYYRLEYCNTNRCLWGRKLNKKVEDQHEKKKKKKNKNEYN